MKCRWSHCKHGGEVDKSEAVQVGSAYYHKDCYTEKKSIEDISAVYTERVDPNPIIPAIRKVINDLVFNKGYDAEYLLYAVKYCLDSQSLDCLHRQYYQILHYHHHFLILIDYH